MNHKDFNKKSHKGVCLLCWTQLWLLSIEFISNKFQIYETVFFIMSPLILHNQQFEFKIFLLHIIFQRFTISPPTILFFDKSYTFLSDVDSMRYALSMPSPRTDSFHIYSG